MPPGTETGGAAAAVQEVLPADDSTMVEALAFRVMPKYHIEVKMGPEANSKKKGHLPPGE